MRPLSPHVRPSPPSEPPPTGRFAGGWSMLRVPSRITALPRIPAAVLPHVRMGVGVFCSAVLIAAIGRTLDMPLLMAPFLATAALKHSAPHLPGVAPRRVIGGHFLGAVVGVAVGSVAGEGALAVAVAASVAAVAMMSVDLLHAPGVATAAVAVQGHGDHLFPITVVLVGAATLVATTMVLSPLLHGRRYPTPRPRLDPTTTS